jgi:hypothetical protein
MKLCDYLKDLSIEERADFAKRCDTSPDYLWQIGDGCEELLPEADWAYIRRRKVVA